MYFDSLRSEYIGQEALNKIKDKPITHHIFRKKSEDFIMTGFYCIAFTRCVIAWKTLLVYTNLFSPIDYQKNDKIIFKYFKDKHGKKCKPLF